MNSARESNGECYTETMPESLVSVSAGLVGLVGAALFSLVAAALVWRRGGPAFAGGRGDILVLLPAHNEERNLPATLASVRAAATSAGVGVRIIVGADACSDQTAHVARASGAEVREFHHRSKWKTLRDLSREAAADQWVALVDAGAQWPKGLLENLRKLFGDATCLGVAPAYYPRNASAVERLLWLIEARWKKWENIAGGPISAHGATIFFRGEVLRRCFAFLDTFRYEAWLNDDIALPMAARILFPGAPFPYWRPALAAECVSDCGVREAESQFGRRRRLVLGNFQWVVTLWPRACLSSLAAGLLALRRFVRIFWAYWGLCLAYGIAALFTERREALALTGSFFLATALLLWVTGKKGVAQAALASLAAPFFFPWAWRKRSVSWS